MSQNNSNEDYENRQEYRPLSQSAPRPRSASVSAESRRQRAAPFSATSPRPSGGTALRPTSLRAQSPIAARHNEAGGSSLPIRRVFSAIPRSGGGPSLQAWTSAGDESGMKKVHVQSLARNKHPEALAEDVVNLKQELNRAKDEAKLALTEKRRLEAEVVKLKQSLLKSEELMNNKERVMGSTTGISQLYRSPDTTHLVGNLKEQNKDLRAARDALASEMVSLQKSTRSTRAAELQAEVFALQEEMDRLNRINQIMSERLAAADQMARDAAIQADEARKALDDFIVIGAPIATDENGQPRLAANSSVSQAGVRKTLKAMLQAHKLLLSQAELIRTVFHPGMSLAEFTEKARQRSNTAGAPDVLNFLRNHAMKLQGELSGQPGAPAPPSPEPPRSTLPSPSPSPAARRALASKDQPPPDPRITTHGQLLETVANLVRKLRAIDEDRFRANPEFETSSEQLADLCQLYTDEVRRLQGKEPAPIAKSPKRQARATNASEASPQPLKLAPVVTSKAPLNPEPVVITRETVVHNPVSAPEPPPPPPPPKDPVPYSVLVHTGDGAFSGSAVYVTLHGLGADGSTIVASSEVLIDSSGFMPRTQVEVKVDIEDIGEVKSLTLRTLGPSETPSDPAPPWSLESIEVQSDKANNGSGLRQIFIYEAPVGPQEVPSLHLFPKSNEGDVEYEVIVTTGDVRGAGTDGLVQIRLVGDKGCSGWIELVSGNAAGSESSLFSRSQVNTFNVTGADVGDIGKVLIRLAAPEGGQSHSDWNLSKVEVLHQETGWKSVFYANDWIERNSPAALLLLEADTWKAKTSYKVKVSTSDLNGAEFEGKVFVTLSGWWGTTKDIRLISKTDKKGQGSHAFKRNATDEFNVTADDVGPISSVTVRIEAAGEELGDAWGLDKIEVEVPGNEWFGGLFTYASWLTHALPSATIWKWRDEASYAVKIFTSSVENAAFDGDIYIKLTGAYGDTDEMLLANDTTVDGARGLPKTRYDSSKPQEFVIKCKNVGNLVTTSVRIDASGTTSSWNLDKIEVTPPAPTVETDGQGSEVKPVVFDVDEMWLKPEDGFITIGRMLAIHEYKVKVVTSDLSDNFDGNVYVKLTGLDGSSEEVKLTPPAPADGSDSSPLALYNSGATSEFTIKAGCVGTLSSLQVRMESTGSSNWWSLGQVIVTHVPTGDIGYFRYNSWLNSWWNSSVSLTSQSIFEYQLSLVISPSDLSTYDGEVQVQIQGSYTSDWISIPRPDGANTYSSKGLPAATTVKLTDLGSSPYSCLVKLVGGSRIDKGIKIERVELKNLTTYADVVVYPLPSKDAISGDAVTYCSNKAMLSHYAMVKTSGQDFDGEAFLTLVCESGETDEVQLLSYDCTSPLFTVDGVVGVNLRTYDMGKVLSLKVRSSKSGWSLDRIQMYSYTGDWATHTYYCGKKLLSGSIVPMEKLENVEYVITIETDDVRGNGTDGQVYITLVGDKGQGDEQQLCPSDDSKAFERGSVDKVTLTSIDLGALKEVKLRLGVPWWSSAPHSDLRLSSVKLLNMTNGSLSEFTLNDWIGVNESISIPLSSSQQTFRQYRVTVVGAHSSPALSGYGARIKITGDSASTNVLRLLSSEAVSDEGTKSDVYKVSSTDVGSLSSIDFVLGDAEGQWSYANISRVEVLNETTQSQAVFLINTYVYSWYGLAKYDAAPKDTQYTITLKTAALNAAKGSGTYDGRCTLVISGENGSTEESQICNWWQSNFDSTNYFYLNSVDVGVMSAVTIRAAPGPSGAKLGLASLEILNNKTNGKAVFEWGKTIDPNATLGVRILKTNALVAYDLVVKTGDVRGASTDGLLEIQIGGSAGSSDWITLSNGDSSNFSRGGTDKFSIQAPSIGDNRWATLRLKQNGETDVHSSLFVSSVDILNKQSGYRSTFNLNNWLGTSYWGTTLQEASYVQALVKYNLRVATGNLHGADFDGDAFIKLNGYDGCSEEIKLVEAGFSKSRFVRGGCADIAIQCIDVGYIYSIDVRMDVTGDDRSWNLTSVEVQQADKGEAYVTFNCGKWLDEQNPSSSLSRYQEMVDYSASAYSSYSEGLPAFDGRVVLVLNGQWGSTDEIQLSNYSDTFPSDGSIQSFNFRGSNVGPIHSVSIRLLAQDSTVSVAPKWSLGCISISRSDGYLLSSAFMLKEADGQTQKPVLLEIGSESVLLPKDRPIADYKVVVVTSDDAEAAFDGEVFLSTYGNDGTSDEIKLSNQTSSAVNFAAGSSAEFSVKLPDMGGSSGSISRVQLRANFDSATTSNWSIKRVELERLDNQSKLVMPYNSYVNNWSSTAYLYPSSSYNCTVTVKTSDLEDADFDGAVFLTLSCGWGEGSGEIELVNSSGRFARGSTEEFQIKVPNVYYLGTVSLRLDASQAVNSADKWAVDSIEVAFTDSCNTYTALVNDWVDPASTPTFTCSYVNSYTVSIETSVNSEPWDGETYLSLLTVDGSKSNEVKLPLNEVLRAGCRVQLEGIKFACLYNLKSAVIRTVATGSSTSWTPSTLELSGQLFSFNNTSIAAPGKATGELLPTVSYEIKVYCSDVQGNGTDGDLSVAFEGAQGKTQDSSLWLTGSNDLQRGSTSTSTVSLPNLGSLNTLLIRLKDPNGSNSLNAQLRVDKVEVVNLDDGSLTVFPVDAWLTSTSSASEASRFTADESIMGQNVFTEYKFDVFTSDGSSFDGEVQFKIYGVVDPSIDSGCLTMGTGSSDGQGLFKAGGMDSIVKKFRDLGAPAKIYGNVNSRGSMSLFGLKRVVVTQVASGSRAVFKPQDSLYTWNYWTEVPKLEDVSYQITSSTANTSSKGFNGEVFVKLFGTDGESREVKLDFNPYYYDLSMVFQPSGSDSCTISTMDVGRLTQIEVRVQGGKPWTPSGLEVTNLSSSAVAIFENDLSISPSSSRVIQRTIRMVEYEVSVSTGDVLGAGTDGQVYLCLSGDQGVTDEVLVSSSPDSSDPENLRRGAKFTFTFSGQAIGENRKATVRLAPLTSGSLHSGWNLASLEVMDKSSGIRGTYNHNAWLPIEGGSATVIESTFVQALKQFTIRATTSDIRDADFDGKVFIQLHGYNGSTSDIPLVLDGRTTASFERGQTSEFKVKAQDVGYVYAINVRMQPSATDPDLCLDSIEVYNEDAGSTDSFPCGKRLNTDSPTAYIYRTSPLVDYQVKVYTMDQVDAGFDGEVSIRIEGKNGATESLVLIPDDPAASYSPPHAGPAFLELKVKGSDVGTMTKVHVTAVAKGKQTKWFADKIEITGPGSESPSTFLFRDWVTAGGGEVVMKKDLPLTDWKVVVVTSSDDSAAFDGSVFLTLNGTNGSSDEIKLDETLLAQALTPDAPAMFGKGASSSFMLPKASDVGLIQYAIVRIEKKDAEGTSSSWSLDRVEVVNTSNNATSILPFKSSLNVDWYSTTYVYPQSSYTFNALIYTSDVAGADFNGNVFVTPKNWWTSQVEEIKLQPTDALASYEKGSCREATFKVKDLSWITSLDVRIDATGSSKSWHLDRIELTMEGQTSTSAFIHKGLLSSPDQGSVTLSYQSIQEWDVTVHTSASSDMFDGKFSIAVAGDDGASTDKAPFEVTTPDPNVPSVGGMPFMPGGKVGGKVRLLQVPGVVKSASFDVDFVGDSTKWTIERVEMSCGWMTCTFFLNLNSFGKKSVTRATSTPLETSDYDIVINTSDIVGSGTDGSVTVTVVGEMGTSGEQKLASSDGGNFERGRIDTFSLSCLNLGEIKGVTVNLSDGGSGVHSQWHVQDVLVLHKKSGDQTAFSLNDWVQPYAPVVLGDSHRSKTKNVYVPYLITLSTSDQSDAAYDGEIVVKVKGENGASTYDIPLRAASDGASVGTFERGSKMVFKVKAADVGAFSSVSLTLNNKANLYSYRPKQVEVLNEKTKAYAIFSNSEEIMYSWYGAADLAQSPSTTDYTANVYLSSGPSFSGKVYAILNGELGRTQELRVTNPWYDTSFDPGSTLYGVQMQSLPFASSYNVGPVSSVEIRVEDSDGSSGSLPLDRLEVISSSLPGSTAEFKWNKSVSSASPVKIDRFWASVDYELVVYTADMRGAGTDSDVYLTISGDDGSAQEIRLYNGPLNFSRGATDKFQFKARDVGANKKLSFRLDGSTGHSGWCLGRIELTNMTTLITSYCYYNSWIVASSVGVVFESHSQKSLFPYVVTLVTGEDANACLDAGCEVSIKINGWYGSTDYLPVNLGKAVSSGPSEDFIVNGRDVGMPCSIDVKVKFPPGDSNWLLDKVTVVNKDSGYSSDFEAKSWFEGSKRLEGTFYRWTGGIDYKLVAYTSKDQTVPYDGGITARLNGIYGSTEDVLLVNASPSLAPGSAEVYTFSARDVGPLSSVSLQATHVASGAQSLSLDRIEVTNISTGLMSSCPLLVPLATSGDWVEASKELKTTDYKVVVFTSDVADGGFDGQVYLKLTGIEGEWEGEVSLSSTNLSSSSSSTSIPFGAKSTDTFLIKGVRDIGALTSLSVRIDASSATTTSWHLHKVEVSQEGGSSGTSTFAYCSYLNAYCPSTTINLSGQHELKVTVRTSKGKSGEPAFDGNVFLSLNGYWGSMGEVQLQGEELQAAGGLYLESSALTFTLKTPDLGSLTSATVRIACGGKASSWSLDSIDVMNLTTGVGPSSFYYRSTLSSSSLGPVSLKTASTYNYKATLRSTEGQDSTLEAGDAKVWLSLVGDTGLYSDETPIDITDSLGAGGAATANFSALELGELSGLRLRLAEEEGKSAAGKKWHVKSVELLNVDTGVASLFFFESQMGPSDSKAVSRSPNYDYSIAVDTSDVRGNGTDGKVLVTLHGDKGASPELELNNWSSYLFERGSVDESFSVVAPSIGEVLFVTVRLADPSYDTLHSGWHMARISVLSPGTGKKYTFVHGDWLTAPDRLSVKLGSPTIEQVQDPISEDGRSIAEPPARATPPPPAPAPVAPPAPPVPEQEAAAEPPAPPGVPEPKAFDAPPAEAPAAPEPEVAATAPASAPKEDQGVAKPEDSFEDDLQSSMVGATDAFDDLSIRSRPSLTD